MNADAELEQEDRHQPALACLSLQGRLLRCIETSRRKVS